MRRNFWESFLLLFSLILSVALTSSFASAEDMTISDPHPQAYFCKSFPVNEETKFRQYENQMKEARRTNSTCRKQNRKQWRTIRDAKLKDLERQDLYNRRHFHNDDWRTRSGKRLSNQDISKAKKYAEYVADKAVCPHFIKPVEDAISESIDDISWLNDLFKNNRESQEFADNLSEEIFNWVFTRAVGDNKLELDDKGRLKGNEFKGGVGFFGKLDLYFSDGRSKPERVLHFLGDYIESGTMEDRKFKLAKVQILLDVFQEILTKDAVAAAEFATLKPSNIEQVIKYRELTKQVFRAVIGQTDKNRAVKMLGPSTHAAASSAIKDFLEIKLDSFEITGEEDKESILGAVSYVLGETDQNTNPPIESRDFEFFEGSSLFGAHLKGDVKKCLECALNMSAIVMCYQRAYTALQDPLVKWTLRKFEINTPALGSEESENGGEIQINGSGNSGTTRVDASLGTIGDRFEDYLETGDFFQSFLQPSTPHNEGPQRDQSQSINFLNTTKNVFENAYSNPPTKHVMPSDFVTDDMDLDTIKADYNALNWMGFQNDWFDKRQRRIYELTEEVRRDYAQFSAQQRPSVTFEEALANRIQQDPYLDKIKLHYAMESTLRHMTEQSITTLLKQLNLTKEDIENMEEPLKSKAIQTRKMIEDKKLDIFSRTIPNIVGNRLDEVLNDPEMKDLPLFEYAIENLRKKSFEDGFEIINNFMRDPSIQQVVQGVSEFKYTEIVQKFDLEEGDEISKGLRAIIVGTGEKRSLSNEIFGEVQNFFREIHTAKETQGIDLVDEEFGILFDQQLLKLNDRLLNYTFTGENKNLFKDLVFNLYEKYMKKIISIDPNHENNPDLMAIKAKIDAFVRDKANDIINTLKARSHGQSPLKVIESIEENLVAVLNQDVFGNGEARDLLKELSNELMAVNIEKYASFAFGSEKAKELTLAMQNRPPGKSKMDVAFNELVNVFYSKYGSNEGNIAEVLLSLKSYVDKTFDSFFEEGNQRTIGELVVDLNDKVTRDLGQYIIDNKDLLQDTIQSQKLVIEDRIARWTDTSDGKLRTAIDNFQGYVDRQLTGTTSLNLFNGEIEKLLKRENIKVTDLIDVGTKFADDRFWSQPESRKQVDTLVDELIATERRRILSLLSKTYDSFDPIKKKRMLRRFDKLFAEQRQFMKERLDTVFEKAAKGEYIEMYQDTLATSIKMMNDNILKESNFRHLFEEVLKDSVTNSIKEMNTATILPESTKQELSRLGDQLVKDLDTIFDQEVEKQFESIGDVVKFVDDIAHYSINEVIITQSKTDDVGSLFASSVYGVDGLRDFKALAGQPTTTPQVIQYNGENFNVPHPRNFKRAATLMLGNLRLKQMPVPQRELDNKPPEEVQPETLGQYISRIQDDNFSIVSPMIGEIAEVIRFQSFCPQFDPEPKECIKDPTAEENKANYNQKFLQALKFIRMAASSEQEGCKKNVSALLKRENLMKLAESSSEINRQRKEYWNLNLWLSEVIKSNKEIDPSIVECALTKTMAEVEETLKDNSEQIENYAGSNVNQIISDIMTPEMLQSLKEENPAIYESAYQRIADFFLNPNESSNINEVIANHVNKEILPKVIETPQFQQKALLLFANTNLNTPIPGGGDSWYADLWLAPGAWLSSFDNDWINTLQNDISANISEQEMQEIYKLMPDCANDMAKKILAPLQLNAQAFLKSTISPNSSAEGVSADGKFFCFKNTDGELHCIPVMEENLEQLSDAQTLEALIRQTTEVITKINNEYTTYSRKRVTVYENGRRRRKTICERKINLWDWDILGIGSYFEMGDSFTAKEKDLIQRYLATLKSYMQDMLRTKFLMRSVKQVLPELRKGNKRLAAVKLREIYLKKSAKSEWIQNRFMVSPYSPGGYLKPAGEFRKKLDKENLEKLEAEFEQIAKCLEE